ncbi:MAG: alanine racemase [Gemmatimonadota bacterium]
MSNETESRAWVDIDLEALRENYRAVRAAVGERPAIIAMVKADGYGLGAARVVRALEPLEPWGYGIATADEGAALRDMGVRRPIVVFGPLPPGAVEKAASAGLVATISDLAALDMWRAAAGRHGPLHFHVEIDTGMGRSGFDWRDTPQWAPAVRARCGDELVWAGAFTHFHSADSADPAPTAAQWERLQDALSQLPLSREDLMVHAGSSAAALRWPEYAADAVRPGIFLYGGQAGAPSTGVGLPRPVASVKARLVLVRQVPPGTTVGYGATHVARGWERWGTVAVGYGDGLPRRLGNRGSALVHGRVVPIVGRISMDMTVVDITGVPEAAVGDVVTLIGRDGNAEITLDQVAAQAETISYEILTGLRPRLPRVEKGNWNGTS